MIRIQSRHSRRDAQHDRVPFAWHLKPVAGGDTVVIGIDVGVVADDGRLRSVTGFLEPVG